MEEIHVIIFLPCSHFGEVIIQLSTVILWFMSPDRVLFTFFNSFNLSLCFVSNVITYSKPKKLKQQNYAHQLHQNRFS